MNVKDIFHNSTHINLVQKNVIVVYIYIYISLSLHLSFPKFAKSSCESYIFHVLHILVRFSPYVILLSVNGLDECLN